MGKAQTLIATGQPRTTRRTNVERTALTRRAITDAAIDILASEGFAALSNSAILERTAISNGALMHHFPARNELLVATVETAYETLTNYRRVQLEGLEAGLPRFRAIIDLAWITSRTREGVAVNEVRIGARSDAKLARAMSPVLTLIADDYARFVARNVREAGLEVTPEMEGLWAAAAMAVRSLSIDRITYQNPQVAENALLALRLLREELIGRQLGETMRIDPSIPGVVLSDAAQQSNSARKNPQKRR